MSRQRKYDDKYFTPEELKEMEILSQSQEVKVARAEARKRAYARSRLYNLRQLYKQGQDLIANEKAKENK